MPIINTPVSSREEYYDRNPSVTSEGSQSVLSENTALTEQQNYTVPTGKKAFLNLLALSMSARVAATSTTTSDEVLVQSGYTKSGGAEVIILEQAFSSPAYVAGDHRSVAIGGSLVMLEGDRIDTTITFVGDAGGAGRVRTSTGYTIIEFDG